MIASQFLDVTLRLRSGQATKKIKASDDFTKNFYRFGAKIKTQQLEITLENLENFYWQLKLVAYIFLLIPSLQFIFDVK